MSVTYRFIALSRARFDAIWACRDEALLAKVLAEHPRHVEHDGGSAIAQILRGGNQGKPYELGSAVEAICHEVGHYLGDFYANDVFRVSQLFKAAGIKRSLLLDEMSEKWPFPIPDTDIDGPFIGRFPPEQLAAELADSKRLSPSGDEMMDRALEWALRLYGEAVAAGTDLVVFQN